MNGGKPTVRRAIALVITLLCSSVSADGSSSSQHSSLPRTLYVWEERPPNRNSPEPSAQLIPTSLGHRNSKKTLPPHPLGTNQWELSIQWRRNQQHHPLLRLMFPDTTLRVELDPSGWCRLGTVGQWRTVGRWHYTTATSRLTVTLDDLRLTADYHSSGFIGGNKRPKLNKGLIVDTTPTSWRPIVATFRGHGTPESRVD